MILSVIIVNYNVKYFLEQALHSVFKAMQGIEGEVFVVDNHSADGSCEMVSKKFPQVKLISNLNNVGFSAANNQAIRLSSGKYVLLLNPDTVVEEDCFSKCIDFMERTPGAGALGVRMIDGKGKFLPESKRGLPTPQVAFYKMFGFASFFPKSKTFGKYHLGFYDEFEVNPVEVLSGAFMFIRKQALEKSGLLDEDYFMYGEDIDLSYRITQSGYLNYYFPKTTIIHYKGESTKKTSVNYVFVFYRAMIVFAQKHYSQKHAHLFSSLINIAIYIRAAISLLARFMQWSYLFIIDAVLMYLGVYLVKEYWENNHKFIEGGSYPPEFMLLNASLYTLLWLLGLYFAGAYDKPRSIKAIVKGVFWGSIGISIFYAFAPLELRFSRAIIVLGIAGAITVTYLNRLIQYLLVYKKWDLSLASFTNSLIVGNAREADRVSGLLFKTQANCRICGYVAVQEEKEKGDSYLGNLSQLESIIQLFNVEEIIFCSKDISAAQIIQRMSNITMAGIQYKIVPEESLFVIGSNSKNTAGDFYALEIQMALNEPLQQRKKRLLDIVVCMLMLPLIPLLLLINRKPSSVLTNWLSVLIGKKTWVGYALQQQEHLPPIRKGVLTPAGTSYVAVEQITANKLNYLYAKDYSVEKDLLIVFNALSKLGG
ncbi:MAG: glycosyltransferase family 2 protein [Bacteroidia bacterium]|jgi:GT2 family glycosyltransferase|nr:glycosyltransferase family 2 protein [Bacteroidia bacterium]